MAAEPCYSRPKALSTQGVTDGVPHNVLVSMNGANLGELNFTGQGSTNVTLPIPRGILQNVNTVTLTGQGGADDLSLVDHVELTYPRTYTAQSDSLKFTAQAGDQVVVHGFAQPPTRLIDITDSSQPLELEAKVAVENGCYLLRVEISRSMPGMHTCWHFPIKALRSRGRSSAIILPVGTMRNPEARLS